MLDCIFCIGICAAIACIYFVRKSLRSSERLDGLKDRPVFITGCDTGFGRELAVHLDKMGVPVYAGCYNEKSTIELTEICSSNMKPLRIDIGDTKSVHDAAKYVEKDLDGKALWAVVNNAGISGAMVPFQWITKEHCRQVLEVNVLGTYDVTLKFLPLIQRGKEGRIVNMASVAGRIAISATPYVLSKFAVEGFSDGLSHAVDPYNITVHTIEPAFFRTSMVDEEQLGKHIRSHYEGMDHTIQDEFGGEEFLVPYIKYMQKRITKSASSKTYLVAEAYEHALFAKYPQNRYMPGTEAKLLYHPISLLPSQIQMKVVKTLSALGGLKAPRQKNAIK